MVKDGKKTKCIRVKLYAVRVNAINFVNSKQTRANYITNYKKFTGIIWNADGKEIGREKIN